LSDPLERLAASLEATIERLEDLRVAAGVEESSYFNFAVADGERLLATRYSSRPEDLPASLHYTSGSNLRCESGKIRLDSSVHDPDVVMIVSEETSPDFCWSSVPVNHLVLAQHPGLVDLRPLGNGSLRAGLECS
jgi:predicted glutamine amidotransferase